MPPRRARSAWGEPLRATPRLPKHRRRLVPVALFAALLAPALVLPAPAAADHCDPEPIGRCGAFNREQVVMCYLLVEGRYLSPSDPDVLTVGVKDPLAPIVATSGVHAGSYYVRQGPAKAFLGDPLGSPPPLGTVWREWNSVPGLQMQPFRCGYWVWFSEFEHAQWLGPFAVISKLPDEKLA